MARYTGPREKIERRLGTKLFLKGERSLSSKSATVKRMYPPGVHGKTINRRPTEFGSQLRSKQRVRVMYRMLERQFKNLVKEAIGSKAETGEYLINKLEYRLDNVVYRGGFAQSRDQARQLVNHGHILVNGRKVSIPSSQVKRNDVVTIREGSAKNKFFASLAPQWIKNYQAPPWLVLNPATMNVVVQGIPTIADSGVEVADLQSLVEYYSR